MRRGMIAAMLVVNPDVPAQSVAELIRYAKTNPGKVNFASAGNGTTSHLAGELFKTMADVDIVHIPYRGGAQAVTDLVGGQVQDALAQGHEGCLEGLQRRLIAVPVLGHKVIDVAALLLQDAHTADIDTLAA